MAKNTYSLENENKKALKAITLAEIIIIGVFAIVIVTMLAFFFLFHDESAAPKLFGYNIYLSRVTNMTPAIPENTAIFAKSDELETLEAGNVVLCNVEYEEQTFTTILRIQDIQLEDGVVYYILKGDTNPANETVRVSQDNVIAKCIYSSEGFGKVLAFATSTVGIVSAIIIPCVLFIIIQVLRILRLKRLDDYDEYATDDVAFSNFNGSEDYDDEDEEDEDELPAQQPLLPAEPASVKKLYIGGDGKAEYINKAAPTASLNELHETIRTAKQPPAPQSVKIPSAASVNLSSQRETVSSNLSQKLQSKPSAASEIGEVRQASRPFDARVDNTYDRPRLYYDRQPEQSLSPPAVENPSGVTIPAEAVKPKVTVAPPLKKQNNKTVEELMKVIDQAQSGLKK